mgnify:CR=1 FL=1
MFYFHRACSVALRRSVSTRINMEKKTCYAAEKNKTVILEVLRPIVENVRSAPNSAVKVLEIASGTGEHAALFASEINNIVIQPTEPQSDMHESISCWSNEVANSTGSVVNPPLALDVTDESFEAQLPRELGSAQTDVVVCINMIHISPFQCTEALFRVASQCLKPGGCVLTYGPYRVNGEMVESNVSFDESLRRRNAEWGVRDLEAVAQAAQRVGIQLERTVSMPANNLCVVFRKVITETC